MIFRGVGSVISRSRALGRVETGASLGTVPGSASLLAGMIDMNRPVIHRKENHFEQNRNFFTTSVFGETIGAFRLKAGGTIGAAVANGVPNRAFHSTRNLASLPGDIGPSNDRFQDGKPTLKYAREIPLTYASKSHDTILVLAEMGVSEACRECLVRNIMTVDNVTYDEAMKKFEKIEVSSREGVAMYGFPFKLGIATAFTTGVVSTPLVFERRCMEWFNTRFVTAELPPPEDMETWLEIGAASWGWMEPLLGQISFFLLCMAFSRSQMQNLGIRPYFNWQRNRRAEDLVEKYPRYDAEFLEAFSKCISLSKSPRLSK